MAIETEITHDVPEGFKETELGALPEEWQVVRLGAIAVPRYGKAKPPSDGSLPVIGSGGVYGWTDRALVEYPTVVVGRKGTAGQVWLAPEPCWPSDTTFYLEWRGNVDVSFVWSYLRLHKPSGQHAKTTLPSLQKRHLEDLLLPLPPLDEQRAIARVLSTIQRAIEATDRVIASARQLKRSLMRHLFTYGPVPLAEAERVPLKETEIGPVPEHWEVVRLGDVATIGNGSTPKRSNPGYWEGGAIPWLTSAKVHEMVIGHADQFVTELARAECYLPTVRNGSVVVAITGQGKTLGNAALVTFDTTISQHLACVQFDGPHVCPEYVLAYLHRQYADLRSVSQAGGSTKGALTCGFLKGYHLPLPPLEEQELVAGALTAIGRKIETAEKRKAALKELFCTMLHLLMTGQIRVTPSAVFGGEGVA